METVVAVGVKMDRVAVAMVHGPMGSGVYPNYAYLEGVVLCRNLASQKVILQQYPQYAPFYDFRHPATPSDEE